MTARVTTTTTSILPTTDSAIIKVEGLRVDWSLFIRLPVTRLLIVGSLVMGLLVIGLLVIGSRVIESLVISCVIGSLDVGLSVTVYAMKYSLR